MIDSHTVQKIKDASKLIDVIPNLKGTGSNKYITCPKCGKEGKNKGLSISAKKNVAKCFSCGYSISSAVTYLMEIDNMEYVPALEQLANQYGISIESESDRKERLNTSKRKTKEPKKQSKAKIYFLDKQLQDSGLSMSDVEVKIKEKNEEITTHSFTRGTKDQYGIIRSTGDDFLIHYYNLEGEKVMYRSKSGKLEPLIRVRWQNPALHLGRNGRPIKYQSPAGSGSHLYIPSKLREIYQRRGEIKRLFIQEGEKKAEKSCKHGIPSVGIMGIQNMGSKNQLPPELQLIIQACNVKEIIFLLDSDWNHLADTLKLGDIIDQRPKNFFYAVKNYKEYIRTLVPLGISVEIYFGHIKNDKDKGIDDLLTNTLAGQEDLLLQDIENAIHSKAGEGDNIQLHKITQSTDKQIADLWLLNDASAFANHHRKKLEHLAEFKIDRILRRFNDESGELELAQPLASNEEYWEYIEKTDKEGVVRSKTLSFNYYNCWNFLHQRGFFRIILKSGEKKLCCIENRVIKIVDHFDIRDYVTEFTKAIKKIDVLNMLYRGGPQYLGIEKLSNLDKVRPNIERATKDTQCLYFKDKIWEISADGIKEKSLNQLTGHVWADKIIDFKPTLVAPLVDVECHDGEFNLNFTADGQECHFLQFLLNASNFYWRSKEENTEEELLEISKHLINKLTALGYLLHDYKNESELKAVIAMDGKLSEVGSSNGRSGKSLFGKFLEFSIPQLYIAAKNKKLTEDPFIFGEVTEKTKSLFLDDVRANVDFEFFFPLITGKLKVNPKGGQPYTLDSFDTPKLLITTNHAINGNGGSFNDRQAFVAFSDFYNDNHKPIDDFGTNFFSEWDATQWNLYYNMSALCIMLYFKSLKYKWGNKHQGIIAPPMLTIDMRRQRQMMGELFLSWATVYFSEEKLNCREVRKDLQDTFYAFDTNARKYYSSQKFSKSLRIFCEYSNFHFNPNKESDLGIMFPDHMDTHPDKPFIGGIDKAGGIEYFTVADNNFTTVGF